MILDIFLILFLWSGFGTLGFFIWYIFNNLELRSGLIPTWKLCIVIFLAGPPCWLWMWLAKV